MAEPIFTYDLKVRDYECDTQGHVNNANYQHYFEVARHEFLEKVGLNFHELHLQGIDAVVSSVQIRYKIPLIGMDKFKCTISKIEVVNLINGKLSEPVLFNEAFSNYI